MAMKQVRPQPGMVLTEDTRLIPGEYNFRDGEGIVIGADSITVEAAGVTLRGGCEPTAETRSGGSEAFAYGSAACPDNSRALGFCGTGITVEGRVGVTIRGLSVAGFDQAALLKKSRGVVLEDCDFTGCFTDPTWGWDEHGFHGAILMIDTCESVVRRCRANRVWDALNMRYSHDNRIEDNDFSHTSDTGLKLWNACRNTIVRNDFSYGIRIDPGEVHARDSSCVLIESGSNDNVFRGNDMTHGGDGLFIRVLNGWMSTGNLFEDNDCSWANNNAIEAWSDRNTYRRNRANHSSYGFWLGNSDFIVLEENEAAYNGVEFYNAPEAFGNAGVAIVNGTGSHSVLRGNYIHDNAGPGVAIRHTAAEPSLNWVIEGNRIHGNRNSGRYKGHGIYLKHARMLTIGENDFADNEGEAIFDEGDVFDVVQLRGRGEPAAPVKIAQIPERILAGTRVFLRGEGADGLRWHWDFGDGATSDQRNPEHVWRRSGLYCLSVTADNGASAALDGATLTVLPESFAALDGGMAVPVRGAGREITLFCTGSVPAQDMLALHLRYSSDADPDWDRKTRYPVVTALSSEGNGVRLTPDSAMLEMFFGARAERRGAGTLMCIPWDGGAHFTAEKLGSGLEDRVCRVEVTMGSVSDGQMTAEICAAGTAKAEKDAFMENVRVEGTPEQIVASLCEGDAAIPLSGAALCGDRTPRIWFDGDGAYGVRFPHPRTVDAVSALFYQNHVGTTGGCGESIPEKCRVEALCGGEWREVPDTARAPVDNAETEMRFAPVLAAGVRVAFHGKGRTALCAFRAGCRCALPLRAESAPGPVEIQALQVKLNIEENGNGSPLGDLTARVFTLNAQNQLDECLGAWTVERGRIRPHAVTEIATPGLRLEEGRRYALALGQTEEAASRMEGDYYRWIAGRVDCDETFAIYSDGKTLPTDYEWGTAWLRVLSGGAATELTHDSDHVGIRFGIREMQCRYQTFRAPRQTQLLTDGRTDRWMTLDGALKLTVRGAAKRLAIWAEAGEARLCDPADGRTVATLSLKAGRNEAVWPSGEVLILEGDGVRLSEIEVYA